MLLFLILINAVACASGQTEDDSVKGNGNPLFKDNGSSQVKISDVKKYSDLLVNINSYSTNGAYYQKKYEKQLLNMAGELIEGQDLDVAKESIGFYYDKRSARTDRLFFGVDINTDREGDLDYGRFSVKLIKENVSGIIDLMYKYQALLNENEIVGVVIGFKWLEGNIPQQVNIWIKKEDLHLFYESKITLNEMYQRSTITNTIGKIILLPI
jgi:hypothetical protein